MPNSRIKSLFFLNYRHLIDQLTRRDISSRYKGSFLGIAWSFITPLIMLSVYTFVFSVMFKARWNVESDNKVEFALVLFCGLLTFTIFSEVVTKSTKLIISNTNFVKKVVFPLEILSIVTLYSALFTALISLLILVICIFLFLGVFNWTIIFVPLVLLPLVLLTLGISWILSSISVFFRDIDQIIASLVQVLMFLSPVFYPISNVPVELRGVFYFNPLSYVIEDMRRVVIWGQYPNWQWLLMGTVIGLLITIIGRFCFRGLKGGFADVI